MTMNELIMSEPSTLEMCNHTYTLSRALVIVRFQGYCESQQVYVGEVKMQFCNSWGKILLLKSEFGAHTCF